jgi:hypothetical protein
MRRKSNDEKVRIWKETDFTFILTPSPEDSAESEKTLSKILGRIFELGTSGI